MEMNGFRVLSEKRMRLADTNRAMIQIIVFVSYWPLLAYDVHRLAFPAAFSNQRISRVVSPLREAIMLEFERSKSRLIELRAMAPAV